MMLCDITVPKTPPASPLAKQDTVGFSSLAWAYERATQWRRVLALLQENPMYRATCI